MIVAQPRWWCQQTKLRILHNLVRIDIGAIYASFAAIPNRLRSYLYPWYKDGSAGLAFSAFAVDGPLRPARRLDDAPRPISSVDSTRIKLWYSTSSRVPANG